MEKIIQRIESLPKWGLALLIGVLAFLVYSNSLGNDYALDDTIVILENAKVKEGLVDLGDYFKQAKSQLLEDQYGYRPITLMSFALDIELFGPGAYGGHLMNTIYYALVCILLFFTLLLVFPRARLLFPLLITLLFVVHPIHVEAVANIKSRDEILSLGFCLLSLNMFIQWLNAEKKFWLLPLSFIAFGLGFLSKESAVTFLAIVPLVVLLRPRRSLSHSLTRSAIFPICAGLVFIGISLLGSKSTTDNMALTEGAGIYMEHKLMGNAIFQQHQFPERLATGTGIMLRYWKQFLIPYPLVYYTGYNHIPLTNFGDPIVWLSVLFHLGLLVLGIWAWRKHRTMSFAIGWYFATISIYTHIARPLSDAMADRFLFAPSVGMAILLVYALMLILKIDWKRVENGEEKKKSGKKTKAKQGNPKLAGLGIGMALLLVIFGGMTLNRNKAWKNNLTLFSTDIVNLEDCARCHFHYAEALTINYPQSANQAQAKQDIIHHFKRAIEITPEAYNSYISLGRAYYVFGMPEEGNALLKEATQKYTEQARPWFELGFGLFNQQKWSEAVPVLERAVELAPNREDNYFYLGLSKFNSGQAQEGIAIMQEAQTKHPEQLMYYESLSDMHFTIQESVTGMNWLLQALEVSPNNPGIYTKIIQRSIEFGDTAFAARYQEEARQKGLLP